MPKRVPDARHMLNTSLKEIHTNDKVIDNFSILSVLGSKVRE